MRKSLTKADVLSIQPKNKKVTVAVGDIPGLGLIVHPTGRKVFSLFYRSNGRAERFTIGTFPTVSLAEAKTKARAVLHSVSAGENPAERKRQRRIADTVAELAEVYIERAKALGRRTWREKARILQRYVIPVLGRYKTSEISRRQISDLLDHVARANGPIMANRTFSEIHAMLKWAHGRGEILTNPAASLPKPGEERARTRTLSFEELRIVWRAAERLPYPTGPFAKLLVLTGQRLREVGGMRRSEINSLHSIWTIPGGRTKNKLEHEVLLSPQAVQVLQSCPELGDLLFASAKHKDRPANGFSSMKNAIDEEIAKHGSIPHWTWHDLRRTFRTGLSELGIEPHIAERALSHIDGGVRRVYDRHTYREQKRQAFDRWGALVASLVDSTESEVVHLHLSRA